VNDDDDVFWNWNRGIGDKYPSSLYPSQKQLAMELGNGVVLVLAFLKTNVLEIFSALELINRFISVGQLG